MQIVEECVLWDGSIINDKGLYYYSSTDKKQVDFYNAVAVISGNSCYVSQQDDNREAKITCYIDYSFVQKHIER